MSMEIILAAVIVGGTGLLLGLFLGLAGKKFAVEIDEKEQQVREQLPGNNCGGSGKWLPGRGRCRGSKDCQDHGAESRREHP